MVFSDDFMSLHSFPFAYMSVLVKINIRMSGFYQQRLNISFKHLLQILKNRKFINNS